VNHAGEMMNKAKLREIIFEADTPLGKFFDVGLLLAILVSVIAVLLESVASIREQYGFWLRLLEWNFTLVFTIEYLLRIYCVEKPRKYIKSFFGIVDLLSILPTYLSLVLVGSQSLLVIRGLRLLRVFRIFKFVRHASEAKVLMAAMRASGAKITVFLGSVVTIVIICGTVIYLIEGEYSGFDNIPNSIYWAIVTVTTVGYGDIVPHTILGKCIASVMMVMGYAIIAVPTGIVSVELANASRLHISTRICSSCSKEGHDADSMFCRYCGTKL
jgi:voltage-gated potassium channel